MPGWLSVQPRHPQRIAVSEMGSPRSVSSVQFWGASALFFMLCFGNQRAVKEKWLASLLPGQEKTLALSAELMSSTCPSYPLLEFLNV